MLHFIRLLFLVSLASLPLAHAKPLSPEQTPDPLKSWTAWVLKDIDDLACPYINGGDEQKRCSWPTSLTLDLHPGKSHFAMTWRVYNDSWLGLPGDGGHWPLNVTANGKPALVMDRNGAPAIQAGPGVYQLTGDFLWDSLPESLQIPADAGLIGVKVNDRAIAAPAIRNGLLWLNRNDIGASKPEDSQNNLDIQVFRKVSDDTPLQVQTRLELEVSGQQREIRLPKPLPDGFIPMQIQSGLPARLEADGQLLLQLRPGRWRLDLFARHPGEINRLKLNSAGSDWPDSEIWVFASHPDLRTVEVAQPPAIDASLTNLPAEWKSLPAYKINRGQSLQLKLIKRGDPDPEPNQLTLTRQLWLDFAGGGYTVNDRISGKMNRDWRLNALPDTKLGRVTLGGESQLITRLAGGGQEGVEVRNGLIDLEADSRIEGGIGNIGAAGWEQNFHGVRAELNLPPGWRLLAAAGADNVPDTWISHWSLLDLFMVLIAAMATGRLWSPAWGAFALVTLALIWHEPEAPRYVWLNILAATALLRVLPEGKIIRVVRVYRNLSWLGLCLISIPFMIWQLRIGLYPQLEQPWQTMTPRAEAPAAPALAESNQPAKEMEATARQMKKSIQLQSRLAAPMLAPAAGLAFGSMAGSGYDKEVNFDRIDPKAHVQTGPGLPHWQWRKITLSWNGAVDASQQLRLWLLPPGANLLLHFLRVALLSILALLMFGAVHKLNFKLKPSLGLFAYLLLAPFLALPSQDAQADIPDQTLLEELKKRLTEAPECLPSCTQIQQMQLTITDRELSAALQIQAQIAVAAPLPALAGQWLPGQVLVDDKPAEGLYRDNNQLWLTLSPGSHQVRMNGPVPVLDKFTLPLPLKPRHIAVANTGWEVLGVLENGQAAEQLQFTRQQTAAKAPESANAKNDIAAPPLPPFVKITRALQLGLDWRLTTQISRLSPADSAVVLSAPLLKGESVTTPGVRVKDNRVEVNIPAGAAVFQWQSALEKSGSIHLQAEQNTDWIEVWQADVSPIWRVQATGIPMRHRDNSGRWQPEWRPWPGEELTLTVTRPEAVAGQSLTIDGSNLKVKPGQRLTESALTFSLRSSQGGHHNITLPEGAELQSIAINGQTQPLHQEGRKLTFPVNPGNQTISLEWRQTAGVSVWQGTPQIDLETPSVNANITLELGQDRWVLLTLGPSMGPAVLFWGLLLVIGLLAAGLCKIPLTPLTFRHWLLLLLGLSQIQAFAAAIVIGWLVLMGWRGEARPMSARLFNLMQIAIFILTLLALGLLFQAVEQGLLGDPDMQIAGNQSTAYNLNWYQDRSPATQPTATVLSLPLFVYRLAMLAWSLWLALALLSWLKWGWRCFASRGLWLTMEKPEKTKPPAADVGKSQKSNDGGP